MPEKKKGVLGPRRVHATVKGPDGRPVDLWFSSQQEMKAYFEQLEKENPNQGEDNQ